MKIILFFFLLLVHWSCWYGQNMDSIQKVLNKQGSEIKKIQYLENLINKEDDQNIWEEYNVLLKSMTLKYVTQDYKIISKEQRLGLYYHAVAISNESFFDHDNGKYQVGILKCFKALELVRKVDTLEMQATILSNLGRSQYSLGETLAAIESYKKALKILEKQKDVESMGYLYNNLAAILNEQGNENGALEYLHKSLNLKRKVSDPSSINVTLDNIGTIYNKRRDFESAEYYLNQSFEQRKSKNDSVGLASSYLIIGQMYCKQGNISRGILYQKKSIELLLSQGNEVSLMDSYSIIAQELYDQKQFNQAFEYAQKGWFLANKSEAKAKKNAISFSLFQLYKQRGDYQNALKFFNINVKLSKELRNADIKKASTNVKLGHEYDLKKIKSNLLSASKDKVYQAKLKKEKHKRYLLYSTLVFAFIAVFFVVRSIKQNKVINILVLQQKSIVDDKAAIIEEKQKEIFDSITYAQRIQKSLQASNEQLQKSFGEYFVIYLPKDIVSGDFYWSKELKKGTNALFLGDSTGHGVSGAIMSMLNVNCLEKVVQSSKSCEPAEILNQTRDKIIETLKKDPGNSINSDGMDCSIVVFDVENRKLKIAAANQTVYVLRKEEVLPYVGNPMQVGANENNELFTQSEMELQKNDIIYLFSDGLMQQIGGKEQKILDHAALKKTILRFINDPMEIQKQILTETFTQWKNTNDQADDVTVIGIRVA